MIEIAVILAASGVMYLASVADSRARKIWVKHNADITNR